METNISLLVATRGRTQELKRLLDSLAAQTYQAFEVIVIDQNSDDRISRLLDYGHGVNLRHIRSDTHGHAAANNVGLRACKGDIITFPDDDCWYAPDLLRRVVDMFDMRPDWDGLSGCEAAGQKSGTSSRFDDEAGRVTLRNIWRRHISMSVFYKKKCLDGLFYDESLGVGAGTIWGSGEETDFLLRYIERGCFVQYEPSLSVYHRDWGQGPYTIAAITKARRYGMGMGRVLQTHQFSVLFTLKSLARPLLGGAYTLVRGRPKKAVYHWAIFLGRTGGWVLSALSYNERPKAGTLA